MEAVQQEKFSLKWNDFQSNLLDTFKTIRYEENLCDVTLMCGEEVVNAHKLVLSASSDLFLNLFRIKGLSSDDLETKNEKAVYAPYSNSSSQLLQSHSMSHSSNFLQSSDIQSFPSYEEICKVSLGKQIVP